MLDHVVTSFNNDFHTQIMDLQRWSCGKYLATCVDIIMDLQPFDLLEH